MDRKLDSALSQLQVCVAGIDLVKSSHRQQPSSDVTWERGRSGTVSDGVSEMRTDVDDGDDGRKASKAWLSVLPGAPEGFDVNFKHSKRWCERTVSDTNLARLGDEGACAQAAASHLVRSKTVDSVGSMSSIGSIIPPSPLQQQHSRIWSIINNDDDSPNAIWWARLWVCFVMLSVLFTLTQALEAPPVPAVGAAVVETVIDVLFGLEFVVRYATTPDLKHFVMDPFILIDFVSVLPIVPRALIGLTLPQPMDSRNFLVCLLVCGVPILRLAKLLRWTPFQLMLFERVLASTMETLQFLALCGSLMVLNFAFWIFLAEPRESVDTYWKALYFVIVTMTTVGYGDVVMETTEGHAVVTILIACSVLFMAIPIGVLGHAFALAWSDRDLILLTNRTQRWFKEKRLTTSQFLHFFREYDQDMDGQISLDEFTDMLTTLKVKLKNDRVIELFERFDLDHGGSIDANEFMRAVFPEKFFEEAQREKKEKRQRREHEKKKRARQEERYRKAKIDQGRGG